MPSPVELPAWAALRDHFSRDAPSLSLPQLFRQDAARFANMSLRLCCGADGEDEQFLLLDYSKNLATPKTMALLLELAQQAGVAALRQRMFAGDAVNSTEQRAVLHVALRSAERVPCVQTQLDKMRAFSDSVRAGRWTGYTGRRIADVVNIGIGGSDLGPALVCDALQHYAHKALRMHFVSNVDGSHLANALRDAEPEQTLFVIASKTFTTHETLLNARSARHWFLSAAKDPAHMHRHFVAVSANAELACSFGIAPHSVFELWDWVGGRYSLWSAVGLPVCLSIGFERFAELLRGAHAMDDHFCHAPPERNMPLLLGLLGIWYTDFFQAETHAILPYDQQLRRLPAYLQQADMESNGKSTDREGRRVPYATGPVVWGQPGTNAQHAFFQLLHQGTRTVPCDFLVPLEPLHALGHGEHHDVLVANAIAQTQALMLGKSEEQARAELRAAGHDPALAPHKTFAGNRPSTTLLYSRLTPLVLGALIALYEHKIFVQGAVWNINSFDQWGVELGKQLAKDVLAALQAPAEAADGHDASTAGLVAVYRQQRARRRSER
jgi:glucose-6-phosphate isomerase